MSEDTSEPEVFSDTERLVAMWDEVKNLRTELMLREDYVRQLTDEVDANDKLIFKMQQLEEVLRAAVANYSCHVSGCSAFYLRNDPNCICGLCDFLEKMGI